MIHNKPKRHARLTGVTIGDGGDSGGEVFMLVWILGLIFAFLLAPVIYALVVVL